MNQPRPEKQSCSFSVEYDPNDPVDSALEAVELAMDSLAASFPEPFGAFYTFRFDRRNPDAPGEPDRLMATVTAQPRRGES